VDVTGGQGVQLGDGNVQINLFAGGQSRGPIVAGSIPQPAPAFQPRADLVAALREAGSGVCVVRAVTGLRGVGKTQLAAAYARDRRQAGWRLVAWVNAETTPAILDGLAVVADRLGIERAGKTLEDLGLEVRNRLEADGERCLIVFDNVTDPGAITPYVPSIGDPQVLITSTESAVTALGNPVEVEVFTEEEALVFLAARTRLDDQVGARLLASELGRLPLALAQAAAVIAARHLTYPVYLDRLRAYPAERYLPAARGEPYPRGVAEAIGLSIDAVAAADPVAKPTPPGPAGAVGLCREVLSVLSLLSPDGVSRELLYLGASADVFASGPEDLDEALAGLAAASLLGFTRAASTGVSAADAPTVTAHRLVMRVARERAARDGTLPDLAMKATALLDGYFRALGGPWQNRPGARDFIRQVDALAANVAFERRAADDERLLDLREAALGWINELADTPFQAVAIGEQLAADNERVRGSQPGKTLSSLSHLAAAYTAVGRVGDAASLYERVLAECERARGESDPDTLTARINLADAYRKAGRVAEAIPLLERGLADHEQVFGRSHRHTLVAGSTLAGAYQEVGRAAEAVPLFERVLAERERALGRSHPDTLTTRNNLASAYRAAGRLAEAVPLLERGLADHEQVFGRSHPYTLVAGDNLASAYQAAGRLAEAVPLFERMLAESERALGPSHPSTLTTMNNLAVAYLDAGRIADGVALLEQVTAGLERSLGPQHPHTVTAGKSLASARDELARSADQPNALD
jgi:tetratricopeptide (TPR) repeat protein